MDLGMLGQVPGPGVEDPHHADLAAEGVGVKSQGLQGGSGGLKEQVLHAVLVRTGHRAQCLREGKGDQKVRGRQEERPLLFQPACRRFMLTLRAMPVLAGMIAVLQRTARGTLGDMPAKRLGAALVTGRHGGQVAGGHTVAEAGAIRGSMAPENVGQLDHERPPETLRGLP